MKVLVREYDNRENYRDEMYHIDETPKKSVTEALRYSKSIIRKHKRDLENFVGFRIYTTRGEFKHKIHNQ